MTIPTLPTFCPDHPDAEILHEWDRTVYQIRGGESGGPINTNHHYYCVICRTELCSPEEFEIRRKAEKEISHG